MTIFDLLFIVVVLASVAALAAVIASALRGRLSQAIKLLTLYGVCLAFYLGVIIVTSLASPQRMLALGENRCYDDWCIAVDDIARSESPTQVVYTVTLRVSSQAKRVSQRENGVVVYMMDEKGRRFESAADPSAAPLNILLQPGQSVTTPRTFRVSGTSGQPVLIVGHQGLSSLPGMFIIGDDGSLFHKPTAVRLP
jgi:hypothetical protein